MTFRVLMCALLLGAAVPAEAGTYRCEGGARIVGNGRCSDGSIAIYTANALRPPGPAQPTAPHRSAPRQMFAAPEAHVFTPAERRQMMENTRRQGDEWVRARRGGAMPGGSNGALMDETRCRLMASQNSYITCR